MIMKIDKIKSVIVILIYTAVLVIERIPWPYTSDDAVFVEEMNQGVTLKDFFIGRFWSIGKIFTDSLADAFIRIPLWLWKIFDICIWVFIALLLVKLFTKSKPADYMLTCILMLMIPRDYLSSAGFICTQTNYVYTSFCILLVFYLYKRSIIFNENMNWHYLCIIPSIFYATNQDQGGITMVLCAILLTYVVIKYNKNRMMIKNAIIITCISFVGEIFTFFIPGHLARMHSKSEMYAYLPQYENWGLATKLFHGYSTTVVTLLFTGVSLFYMYLILLAYLSIRSNKLHFMILAFEPILLVYLVKLCGIDKVAYTEDYMYGFYDLVSPRENIYATLIFIITIVTVMIIFYLTWKLPEKIKDKIVLTGMLTIAVLGRGVMGLSATIYASSFRTFIYLLFIIIALCLKLSCIIKKQNEDNNTSIAITAIAALLAK